MNISMLILLLRGDNCVALETQSGFDNTPGMPQFMLVNAHKSIRNRSKSNAPQNDMRFGSFGGALQTHAPYLTCIIEQFKFIKHFGNKHTPRPAYETDQLAAGIEFVRHSRPQKNATFRAAASSGTQKTDFPHKHKIKYESRSGFGINRDSAHTQSSFKFIQLNFICAELLSYCVVRVPNTLSQIHASQYICVCVWVCAWRLRFYACKCATRVGHVKKRKSW